jgi:hypothetical protein
VLSIKLGNKTYVIDQDCSDDDRGHATILHSTWQGEIPKCSECDFELLDDRDEVPMTLDETTVDCEVCSFQTKVIHG